MRERMVMQDDTKKLTAEQRAKVESVLDDMRKDGGVFSPLDSKEDRWDEFVAHLLRDQSADAIENLMDSCDYYFSEKEKGETFGTELSWIIMYDMWLNNSAVWPIRFLPKD
jgi:hypothetical protein